VQDLDAMPDDRRRYELIDGALYVTAPSTLRLRAAFRLSSLLKWAAMPDLVAAESFRIQCAHDTVLEPDVIVLASAAMDGAEGVVAARHVALVVEIVSRSSTRVDQFLKSLKLQIYVDAGIPTYLVVELTQPTVTWYARSEAGGYDNLGSAVGTEPLHLTRPFEVDIVPHDLVRRYAWPPDRAGGLLGAQVNRS
jgi:Uma2 family endonuclease